MNNILVVITARGGSKGVPRKNIRMLNGKPLIAYAIEAALGVGSAIHKVVVSTDDQEIAEVAKAHGAEVPFIRPAELASDTTPSLPVVQHAVQEVEVQTGTPIDASLLIQPTNPLVIVQDVQAVVDLFHTNPDVSSVVSVVDSTDTHPLKALKIENGHLEPFIANAPQAIRRQDLEPIYKRNGSLYLTRRKTLMEQNDLYGSKIMPYVMPKDRSLDIDTEFDLRLAEFVMMENIVSREEGRNTYR